MAHAKLIDWGSDAFERGISLHTIERHLLRKGLKKHEATHALHDIIAFEKKWKKETHQLRNALKYLYIMLIIIFSILVYLFFSRI